MNARTAAIKALNIIADEINDDIVSCEDSFIGRTASIAAEQFLRDTINKRKQELLGTVNDSLCADDIQLIAINTDNPSPDADARRIDDLNLIIEASGELYWFPVNIKVTCGMSNGNSCGWEAFGWCLFKDNTIRKMKAALKYCAKHENSDELSDYLFWVFMKNPDGTLNGYSYASSLLIDVSLGNVLYNDSQNFPVQIFHPSTDQVDMFRSDSLAESENDFVEQKEELRRFVIGNKLEKAKALYDMCLSALVSDN